MLKTYDIIRIENKEGIGPYNSKWDKREVLIQDTSFHNNHRNYMVVASIDIPQFNYEYFCGYKNINDFQFFVDEPSLPILLEGGFKILAIKTPHICGYDQKAFKKEDVTEVRDITNLIRYHYKNNRRNPKLSDKHTEW